MSKLHNVTELATPGSRQEASLKFWKGTPLFIIGMDASEKILYSNVLVILYLLTFEQSNWVNFDLS